jgi:hypothetical protein
MGMTLDTEEVERNVCLCEGDEGRGMTVGRLGRVKGLIVGREGGKRNDCLWEGKEGMGMNVDMEKGDSNDCLWEGMEGIVSREEE